MKRQSEEVSAERGKKKTKCNSHSLPLLPWKPWKAMEEYSEELLWLSAVPRESLGDLCTDWIVKLRAWDLHWGEHEGSLLSRSQSASTLHHGNKYKSCNSQHCWFILTVWGPVWLVNQHSSGYIGCVLTGVVNPKHNILCRSQRQPCIPLNLATNSTRELNHFS